MRVPSSGHQIVNAAHAGVNQVDVVSMSTYVVRGGQRQERNEWKLNDVIAKCVPYEFGE
jgi:hypothetical protein